MKIQLPLCIIISLFATGCENEIESRKKANPSYERVQIDRPIELFTPPATPTESPATATPISPTEPQLASGYTAMALSAGVDPIAYARSARAQGITPEDALAAELVICRTIGDCPAGMTQDSAQRTLCERVGSC